MLPKMVSDIICRYMGSRYLIINANDEYKYCFACNKQLSSLNTSHIKTLYHFKNCKNIFNKYDTYKQDKLSQDYIWTNFLNPNQNGDFHDSDELDHLEKLEIEISCGAIDDPYDDLS